MHATDDEAVARALAPIIEAAERLHPTAEGRVAHAIRTAIDRGVLAPGERLQQDRLASLLGVSRMPIRAALRQLESDGYVVLEPHRGAQVRTVSDEELEDLYEIRILVESFAMRRVATEADEGELVALQALAAEIDTTPAGEVRAERMNDFYRRLYATANSRPVVSLVMQLRAQVARHGNPASSQHESHHELLDALAMGDPDLSAAWLAAHLRRLAREAVTQSTSTSPNDE